MRFIRIVVVVAAIFLTAGCSGYPDAFVDRPAPTGLPNHATTQQSSTAPQAVQSPLLQPAEPQVQQGSSTAPASHAPPPAGPTPPALPSPAEVAAIRELRLALETEQAHLNEAVAYIDGDIPNEQYFMRVALEFGDTARISELNQLITQETNERAADVARIADIAKSLSALPIYVDTP